MKIDVTPEELIDLARKLAPPTGLAQSGTCQPGSIDPCELARGLAEVAKGNKIWAIKIYRAVTGAGLKDAKDAVERFL